MGEGQYKDVIQIDDVVVKHVGESSKTDTAIPIAEQGPSVRVSGDPLYRSLDLRPEIGSEPGAAPLIPHSRVSVFLGRESMKADFDCTHRRSLTFVSQVSPGHCCRGIVSAFLKSTIQLDGEIVVAGFRALRRERLKQFLGDDSSVLFGQL